MHKILYRRRDYNIQGFGAVATSKQKYLTRTCTVVLYRTKRVILAQIGLFMGKKKREEWGISSPFPFFRSNKDRTAVGEN